MAWMTSHSFSFGFRSSLHPHRTFSRVYSWHLYQERDKELRILLSLAKLRFPTCLLTRWGQVEDFSLAWAANPLQLVVLKRTHTNQAPTWPSILVNTLNSLRRNRGTNLESSRQMMVFHMRRVARIRQPRCQRLTARRRGSPLSSKVSEVRSDKFE